jgi:5-methylcytosine-specific restriction protein A
MRKLQTLKTGKPMQALSAPRALAPLGAPRVRGRRLQAQRARLLRHSPLCVLCLAQGRYKAATQIDHKVARIDGGSDEESNLQTLCQTCHALKSAAEAARRAGRENQPG